MPYQGALSQAALAAACRNTNWEVRQRSGFNELPCCNSNSLVLFTDTLLMRCLSEGKLGWGREREDGSLEGERRTLTSTEAFMAAGPQPLAGAIHSTCEMQVKGVLLSRLLQTGHDHPGSGEEHLTPLPPRPLTWAEHLKGSAPPHFCEPHTLLSIPPGTL